MRINKKISIKAIKNNILESEMIFFRLKKIIFNSEINSILFRNCLYTIFCDLVKYDVDWFISVDLAKPAVMLGGIRIMLFADLPLDRLSRLVLDISYDNEINFDKVNFKHLKYFNFYHIFLYIWYYITIECIKIGNNYYSSNGDLLLSSVGEKLYNELYNELYIEILIFQNNDRQIMDVIYAEFLDQNLSEPDYSNYFIYKTVSMAKWKINFNYNTNSKFNKFINAKAMWKNVREEVFFDKYKQLTYEDLFVQIFKKLLEEQKIQSNLNKDIQYEEAEKEFKDALIVKAKWDEVLNRYDGEILERIEMKEFIKVFERKIELFNYKTFIINFYNIL